MKGIRIRAARLSDAHEKEASKNAISWANGQNVLSALDDLALMPTTSPGARPIWHLGALAVLGQVDRLIAYKSKFEHGDRLGFVNYITKDHISRAISVANKHQ